MALLALRVRRAMLVLRETLAPLAPKGPRGTRVILVIQVPH
jgi:hypothetical protein